MTNVAQCSVTSKCCFGNHLRAGTVMHTIDGRSLVKVIENPPAFGLTECVNLKEISTLNNKLNIKTFFFFFLISCFSCIPFNTRKPSEKIKHGALRVVKKKRIRVVPYNNTFQQYFKVIISTSIFVMWIVI